MVLCRMGFAGGSVTDLPQTGGLAVDYRIRGAAEGLNTRFQ